MYGEEAISNREAVGSLTSGIHFFKVLFGSYVQPLRIARPIIRVQVVDDSLRSFSCLTLCLQPSASLPGLCALSAESNVSVLLFQPALLHILHQQAVETLGYHHRRPHA